MGVLRSSPNTSFNYASHTLVSTNLTPPAHCRSAALSCHPQIGTSSSKRRFRLYKKLLEAESRVRSISTCGCQPLLRMTSLLPRSTTPGEGPETCKRRWRHAAFASALEPLCHRLKPKAAPAAMRNSYQHLRRSLLTPCPYYPYYPLLLPLPYLSLLPPRPPSPHRVRAFRQYQKEKMVRVMTNQRY